MKLFWIPNPWDYHRNDGFIILARDLAGAKKKLQKHVDKIREGSKEDIANGYDWTRTSTIKWDEIEEIKGGITSAGGCDD